MAKSNVRIWTIAIVAIALCGLLALSGCGSSNGKGSDNGGSSSSSTTNKPSSGHDEIDCMLIALGDAGLGVDDVMITDEKVTTNNGIKTYTVEFYDDEMEYEYAINMETGAIIAADSEPRSSANGTSAQDSFNTAEALRAACEEHGLDPEDITITKEEFSKSGGKELYTVEFETSSMRYEYSFDVETGQIFAADSEPK